MLDEFNRIIGNGVVKNWPLVTGSVVVCFAIQFVSALVGAQLFPNTAPPAGADEKAVKRHIRKDKERRADFAIRVVAFVHAAAASVLCLQVIVNAPAAVSGNVYAYHAASETIFSLSSGYFIWDTLTCLFGGWGIGFIAHGLACTFVYTASLYPFLHYWGLFFLLYELSTPFLHLRWLGLQLGLNKSSPVLFSVIQNTFVLAFVAVRLVAGSYASWYWWGEMLALLNGTYKAAAAAGGASYTIHSQVVVGFYLTANIILNGLNWFWFSQMVAAKSGKKVSVAKEAPDADPTTAAAAAGNTAATATDAPAAKKRTAKAD